MTQKLKILCLRQIHTNRVKTSSRGRIRHAKVLDEEELLRHKAEELRGKTE